MEGKKRALPFGKKGKFFVLILIAFICLLTGKGISYARTMEDYTLYHQTNGWYYIRVDSADNSTYGLYRVDVEIKDRYWESNSYFVDYNMRLIRGVDQGISLRKSRWFTSCDLAPDKLVELGYAEVERQYWLPNWIDFNKPGYTLTSVSNEGTAQTYIEEAGSDYTYYIVDTNGCGITRWLPGHMGEEFHDTFYMKFTPNKYTIKYDGNGATGGSIDPQTVNYGDEWTLQDGFTKTGYHLTGYAVVRASDNAIFCGDKGWQSDYGWAHPEEWTIYSAGSTWTMNEAWANTSSDVLSDTFTFCAQWEPNSYLQKVYVRYQNADGSWGSYSPVINTNYNYGSTVSWSRAADSAYKAASISYTVTDANTKYVSVYRNSYKQTINYYYYKASGSYNSPTHTKTSLGSKTWSQLYGTTFNAKLYKSAWGDVTGYHWSSIDSNSWTVTKAASTNSYYSANKYRLNVDLNKGSSSSTPSGRSGNYDMEYGTYIDLGTPAMTGYTFSGWSIIEYNSTDHSLSANTFTMGYNKSYPNQSYTSGSTVKIKAKWDVNSYNLIYDLNDNVGSTRAQFGAYHPNTVKFDTEFTVSNPSRAGYSFAGWNITGMDNSTHYYGAHRTTEGYIDNTCETVFRNLNSSNEAVVTFKAVWIPNTYTIHFDGNGAAGGNVDDITVSYDENMTLPANGYELDRNTFVGWTHDCTAHVGTYAEGQEILSSVIIDAAGMTTQNNGIINLYCAWDPAPNITVSDKTFSLDEARNGLITEERLFEGAYAMDEILDSEILPGTHLLENESCNSFTITNFSEDEFTQFTASGSATITYQVVDSVGNITEETITVFIVDNTPKEAQSGEGTYHVRFISDKYYDKTEVEGGLPEDSIWRKRPEYAEILNEIMGKY